MQVNKKWNYIFQVKRKSLAPKQTCKLHVGHVNIHDPFGDNYRQTMEKKH